LKLKGFNSLLSIGAMVNVKMRSLFPNDIGRELLKDLGPKRW
jgi:hypothetical protein